MFGMIRPCEAALKNGERLNYAGYYCGLCVGMERVGGRLARFITNYDLCLAYLLADSLSAETHTELAFCPYMPYKCIAYQNNAELLRRVSERNFLLTYHKMVDDILDDGSAAARAGERMMRRTYREIAAREPQLAAAAEKGMRKLREQETRRERLDPQTAAAPFASMLAEIMRSCVDDPLDSEAFSRLCFELGAWIYIVDAIADLKKDAASGAYNPVLAGCDGTAEEIIQQRKQELVKWLTARRRSMQELLMLLAFAKNRTLIDGLFTYLLPRDVAQLLR